MENLNKRQILFTSEECNACNRCVYTCPIQGANHSKNYDGKIILEVNNDKCISCGLCIDTCNVGARQYNDDTDRFFADLENGEAVSIIVDPSILLIYGSRVYRLFEYLREKGVQLIYDVSIGGDIAIWGQMKYLIENMDNPERAFIANTCPTVINYFEKNRPDLLKYIVPVESPVMSTAIYVKEYKKDNNKIAYISPCISIIDEITSGTRKGCIDYCVSIRNLFKAVEDIDLDNYKYSDYDCVGKFVGRLLSMKGNVKDSLALLFPTDEQLVSLDSVSVTTERLIEGLTRKEKFKPLIIEFNNCNSGCLFGPTLYRGRSQTGDVFLLSKEAREEVFSACSSKMSFQDYRDIINGIMADAKIKYEDFVHTFTSREQKDEDVSNEMIEETFKLLHKETTEKKYMDCTACGYPTCRELAKAIVLGYAVPDNCIHYLNDEITIRYYTDRLTGRLNKEGFIKEVNSLFKDNTDKHYMIGVVSLNSLNVINDIYGFDTGDELIIEVAELFVKQLEEGGGIVARLGGGDFIFCFEYNDSILRELKSKPVYQFIYLENKFPISMKIGIYDAYKREADIQTMINLATLAMERIEETSTTIVSMYDDDIRAKVAKEADISAKMHEALLKKEFVPYFQPQYNHKTGKMIGAETLCRWFEQDGNMISPGTFIPIFEKNGFIKRLDEYMWERVFEQIQEWQEAGMNIVPISVNVSRLSVMEDTFEKTITDLANKYPIPREMVHFEITESAYTRQQDKLIHKVNKIRKLGFKVAMDDFGSGYSSLNTLKNVPIDILKLDMGFLSNDNEFKGETIIKNVATMASELKLEMISEGVETKEQADFLSQVGCDVIQGYFYARPMPLDQFEMRLKGEK